MVLQKILEIRITAKSEAENGATFSVPRAIQCTTPEKGIASEPMAVGSEATFSKSLHALQFRGNGKT